MTLYKDPKEEIELSELIRRLPVGNYKRWFEKLKRYDEFITRCYADTKEENEILRTLNADLQIQVANAQNSNLPTPR